MGDIANVRRFNGTSDWLQFTSTDYVGVAPNAVTLMAIIKSNTDPADSNYRDILTVTGGTGGQWGYILNNPPAQTPGFAWYIETGDGFEAGDYYQASDGWAVLGFTKPAGNNQTVRLHRYLYASTTWNHVDYAAGSVDQGDAPTGTPNMYIGTWNEAIEFLAADVAVVGVWMGTALNDTQVETLESSILNWDALTPTGLWMLNQASEGTSVLDRMGSADQIDRSGTTVVAPTGLTFDDGVAGGLAWIRA